MTWNPLFTPISFSSLYFYNIWSEHKTKFHKKFSILSHIAGILNFIMITSSLFQPLFYLYSFQFYSNSPELVSKPGREFPSPGRAGYTRGRRWIAGLDGADKNCVIHIVLSVSLLDQRIMENDLSTKLELRYVWVKNGGKNNVIVYRIKSGGNI